MKKTDVLEPESYEPPLLGAGAPIEQVTLFSGVVNPDAGVIDFGNG